MQKLFRQRSHACKNQFFYVQLFGSYKQTTKSKTIDLETKDQGHLRLAEVRWSNTPCWLANACENNVSVSICRSCKEWNSDSLSLKMKGYWRLIFFEYRYTYFICEHFISLLKMLLLGPVVCSWCISRRTAVRTFVHTTPWHNTVPLRWTV